MSHVPGERLCVCAERGHTFFSSNKGPEIKALQAMKVNQHGRTRALQGQGRRQVQFLHLLDCYEVDERGHLQALPPVQHLRPGPRVGAPRRDPLRVCSSRFLKGLAAGTPRLKWAKPRAMFLNGGSVFFNAQA